MKSATYNEGNEFVTFCYYVIVSPSGKQMLFISFVIRYTNERMSIFLPKGA